jgi:hypothetical protein
MCREAVGDAAGAAFGAVSVRAVDPARLANGAVFGAIAAAETARRELDAALVALVAEVDRRGLAKDAGASSTAAELRSRLLMRPGQAADLVRVARAVTVPAGVALPVDPGSDGECAPTGKALAGAELSFEHARVIVRAVRGLSEAVDATTRRGFEAEAIEQAKVLDPGQLGDWASARAYELDTAAADAAHEEAERRAHARRGVWLSKNFRGAGGRLIADLDADTFAAAQAAIEALSSPVTGSDGRLDPRTAPQRRADALGHLVRRALEAGDVPIAGGIRPQVTVTTSLETLRAQLGPAATLADGTIVSAATARRLACDAAIIPAVLGTESELLDLGRVARVATPAQRRWLAAHYRRCAFPGCTRPPSWCEIHHLEHWADGGPTDLTNLAPFCTYHHGVAHHDGWTITRADDGELDFIPPRHLDSLQHPRRQPWLQRH